MRHQWERAGGAPPPPTPTVPPGLPELMEGLSKEVLRHNPTDIYAFCAEHIETLLKIREASNKKPKSMLPLDEKNLRTQGRIKADERNIHSKNISTIIVPEKETVNILEKNEGSVTYMTSRENENVVEHTIEEKTDNIAENRHIRTEDKMSEGSESLFENKSLIKKNESLAEGKVVLDESKSLVKNKTEINEIWAKESLGNENEDLVEHKIVNGSALVEEKKTEDEESLTEPNMVERNEYLVKNEMQERKNFSIEAKTVQESETSLYAKTAERSESSVDGQNTEESKHLVDAKTVEESARSIDEMIVEGSASLVDEKTLEGSARSIAEKTAEGSASSVAEEAAEGRARSVDEKTVEASVSSVEEKAVEESTRSVAEEAVDGRARSVDENTVEGSASLVDENTIKGGASSGTEEAVEGSARSVDEKTVEGSASSVAEEAVEGKARSVDENTVEASVSSIDEKAVEGSVSSVGEKTVDGRTSSVDEKTIKGGASSGTEEAVKGGARSVDEKTAEGSASSVDEMTVEASVSSVDEKAVEGSASSVDEKTVDGRARSVDENIVEGIASLDAEEAVEESALSVDENTVEGTASSVAKKTVEASASSVDEKAVEGTASSVAENNVETRASSVDKKAVEGSAQSADEKTLEGSASSAAEKSVEESASSVVEKTVEVSSTSFAEKAVEGSASSVDEKTVEGSASSVAEKPVKGSEGSVAEKTVEGTTSLVVEKTEEVSASSVDENNVEASASSVDHLFEDKKMEGIKSLVDITPVEGNESFIENKMIKKVESLVEAKATNESESLGFHLTDSLGLDDNGKTAINTKNEADEEILEGEEQTALNPTIIVTKSIKNKEQNEVQKTTNDENKPSEQDVNETKIELNSETVEAAKNEMGINHNEKQTNVFTGIDEHNTLKKEIIVDSSSDNEPLEKVGNIEDSIIHEDQTSNVKINEIKNEVNNEHLKAKKSTPGELNTSSDDEKMNDRFEGNTAPDVVASEILQNNVELLILSHIGKGNNSDDSTIEIENDEAGKQTEYTALEPMDEKLSQKDEESGLKNSLNKDGDKTLKKSHSMDLETAAITIQKVFRAFLFKSRASTSEENTNDGHSLEMASEESNKSDSETDLPKMITEEILNEMKPPGVLTRANTVLQTVNEEKSLSLSTDESSTLSSAATVIQAHVRGFLVRNRLSSNKFTSSDTPATSDNAVDASGVPSGKTVLTISIPEQEHFIADSIDTSVDLPTDPLPYVANLHPLGYDKDARSRLKREDAIQSVSPPSNSSFKLSEETNSQEPSVEQIEEKAASFENNIFKAAVGVTGGNRDKIVTNTEKKVEPAVDCKYDRLTRMSSDEMDVVTPYSKDNESPPRLLHSSEFHDVLLPTRVARNDPTVARGE